MAVAAFHNLRPIAANREWGLAFGFGLFHGMGFASVVGTLDTSRGTRLVSLAGRNIGIELGQLLVIGLIFPGLFIMRKTMAYRPFFVAGSLGLALVATVWVVERALESDTGMSQLIDKTILFPRSLGLVALFAFAAWWIHGFMSLSGPGDAMADVDAGDHDPGADDAGEGDASADDAGEGDASADDAGADDDDEIGVAVPVAWRRPPQRVKSVCRTWLFDAGLDEGTAYENASQVFAVVGFGIQVARRVGVLGCNCCGLRRCGTCCQC